MNRLHQSSFRRGSRARGWGSALASACVVCAPWIASAAGRMDVAPFGLPLTDDAGLMWEDPREVHRVAVHFRGTPPPPDDLHLDYWGSRWPEQRLPKDREPGGGDVGWMELGNWHRYGWRRADAIVQVAGSTATFTFRPVNAREFPKLQDYPAPFRYTLKFRLSGTQPLPAVDRFEVFTDSDVASRTVWLAWEKPPGDDVRCEAFNGVVDRLERRDRRVHRLLLRVAANPDPNTFDKTLITVRRGADTFSFLVNDLDQGPLFLPHLGVAVVPDGVTADYAAVAGQIRGRNQASLYDRVAALPEQTWTRAWEGMPRKKSDIYFPLGLDGGRQRFRLHANGSLSFRSNDHYLRHLPGAETPRLDLEPAEVSLSFDLPEAPVARTLVEESLPVCVATWDLGGIRLTQTAFVTPLSGTDPAGPTPAGDAFTVAVVAFTATNTSAAPRELRLPLGCSAGPLEIQPDGLLQVKGNVRGQWLADSGTAQPGEPPAWKWTLNPGQTARAVLKLPYVVLQGEAEAAALRNLDPAREQTAVADYWRRRLDQSARLITPEPMLNEFYRSHAMHLLVNCEREPGSDRRFARVGSFSYGAYGNESCMMVADLERRGYAREAQHCLDAWLHYQGTVELPGSFASKDGVLYGAAGYEAGGYNQHHGWILWHLAEHYRYTRDAAWLRSAIPGLIAGADWILRETARTADRHPLERGLLPAGSLEDIGDWWTWLSTSCYMWRGLDAAAWALEQAQHPEAGRIRAGARAYHTALLNNFRAAAARSPVVRLRDGTAVPHFPSQVHRRGRSFGWICETLEGALHLVITRAIDPHSAEATWILKDYEDNLFLSNQYGYTLDDFEAHWFGRGGMSMQACLLLNVEPYLYRDDVKHALRGLFNGMAVSYFPTVRMNTEHALPDMDDWRGDHFKSSDESNAAGWLRYLFVREEGDELWIGQAIPRDWLRAGQRCGIERTHTAFGIASVLYAGTGNGISARIEAPTRNPPKAVRVRLRGPEDRLPARVTVNGRRWSKTQGDWVILPGDIGTATVEATYR